ncbi:Uncharacterised protein [BD1-7 clade bacterium]|uniref:Uncharacterized protein n=1 Tax=BD1-7 clade bacterium TaxID=2029982 RepID=A0A5S9PLZ9_9GAMM|nr:Uncharacterised protein [BD1-7 clade bacterium]CAA0105466.1 Uncharacterised protein [BD1-7 clade bacterium]
MRISVDRILPPLRGASQFTCEDIQSIVATGQQPLGFGQQYKGKTGTRVFSDRRYFVKLLPLGIVDTDECDDYEALKARRLKDCCLGIYPKEKTWFIASSSDNGRLFGNIAHIYTPIHVLHDDADRFNTFVSSAYCNVVAMAYGHGLMLDAGLSNFVSDPAGNIYYIDDDRYAWDEFRSFGALVASHLREYPTLEPEILGYNLRLKIQEYVSEADQACQLLAESTATAFIPPAQEARFRVFCRALGADDVVFDANPILVRLQDKMRSETGVGLPSTKAEN